VRTSKFNGGDLMNAFKVIVSTFLASFTLLMINDYFPNTLMSFHIPEWLIISLMVIIFLTSNFFIKEEDNERHTLNWLIVSTGYIVLLMLVLPVLGGNSSTGISFSNPIISVLLVIVLVDIFAKSRKLKVNRYSN
jgi:predicted Na+-dependent transporter